jgi:ribosomal protein S1
VSVGDKVSALVLAVSPESHHLSLSLRQTKEVDESQS